jgi:hypothetical protein
VLQARDHLMCILWRGTPSLNGVRVGESANRHLLAPRGHVAHGDQRDVIGIGGRDGSSTGPNHAFAVPNGDKNPMSADSPEMVLAGVPSGIRTRVSALKGPRPGPLDDGDGWMCAGGEGCPEPVEGPALSLPKGTRTFGL